MLYQAIGSPRKGCWRAPLHVQFVLGVKNAMPAVRDVLEFQVAQLRKLTPEATWTAAGIGRHQLEVNRWSLELGGHCRTGLEDNVRWDASGSRPPMPSWSSRVAVLCASLDAIPRPPPRRGACCRCRHRRSRPRRQPRAHRARRRGADRSGARARLRALDRRDARGHRRPRARRRRLRRRARRAAFRALAPMLDAIRPDGAIVATPNACHVPDGLACIERGVPALIEKPIADDVAGGARLVEAAERAGVALLVGHHHRHNPIIARARELVRAAARSGASRRSPASPRFLKPDPYFVAGPWRREKGGGPVLINLIHGIDDLRFIVGEIAGRAGVRVERDPRLRGRGQRGRPCCASPAARSGPSRSRRRRRRRGAGKMSSGENTAFPQHGEDRYRSAAPRARSALPSLRRWRYEGERSWLVPLAVATETVERADPLARQIEHFRRGDPRRGRAARLGARRARHPRRHARRARGCRRRRRASARRARGVRLRNRSSGARRGPRGRRSRSAA